MSNNRPPAQPWTDADEWEYAQLGRSEPATLSFAKSTAALKDVDVDALSERDREIALSTHGVEDTRYDQALRDAKRLAEVAGSGRRLRADEQGERRWAHKPYDPFEQSSSAQGTNGALWALERAKQNLGDED